MEELVDKIINMRYWDVIDDILDKCVIDVSVMSRNDKKTLDIDKDYGVIHDIAVDLREIIIERLERIGYEFPYVDEEY